VIEKAIENMRRIPHCCVDDFGMEGGVLVGNVSIERHAGIIQVIEIAADSPPSPSSTTPSSTLRPELRNALSVFHSQHT
jgi:hypothetical protein